MEEGESKGEGRWITKWFVSLGKARGRKIKGNEEMHEEMGRMSALQEFGMKGRTTVICKGDNEVRCH